MHRFGLGTFMAIGGALLIMVVGLSRRAEGTVDGGATGADVKASVRALDMQDMDRWAKAGQCIGLVDSGLTETELRCAARGLAPCVQARDGESAADCQVQ